MDPTEPEGFPYPNLAHLGTLLVLALGYVVLDGVAEAICAGLYLLVTFHWIRTGVE